MKLDDTGSDTLSLGCRYNRADSSPGVIQIERRPETARFCKHPGHQAAIRYSLLLSGCRCESSNCNTAGTTSFGFVPLLSALTTS